MIQVPVPNTLTRLDVVMPDVDEFERKVERVQGIEGPDAVTSFTITLFYGPSKEVEAWLTENCVGNWVLVTLNEEANMLDHKHALEFETERDAVLFRMTWL